MASAHPIYTIGHSNHPAERFFELLGRYQIEVVADVRSQPFSRYVPHFCKEPLQKAVREQGLSYVFMGKQLGGKGVDYTERRFAAGFDKEIDRLLVIAAEKITVLLCAEEDPERCHRHLLLEPVLVERGIEVAHIRSDGRLHRMTADERQLSLFGRDDQK